MIRAGLSFAAILLATLFATPSMGVALVASPGSPLEPARAGSVAGRYSAGAITLDLERGEDDEIFGTLTIGGQAYPVRGDLDGNEIEGEYRSSGEWVRFSARLDGDTLTLESGGTRHALRRQGSPRNNPLAEASSSESKNPLEDPDLASSPSAPSSDVARRLPQLVTDKAGVSFRLPLGWTTRDTDTFTAILPPIDPATGAQPHTANFNVYPWTASPADPTAPEQLARDVIARVPALSLAGSPELLAANPNDGVRIRFTFVDPNGAESHVWMYAKRRAGNALTLNVFGPDAALAAADGTYREIFESADWGAPAPAAGSRSTPPGSFTHSSGVTFRHPAAWTAREDGNLSVVEPPVPAGQGRPPITILVESQPWNASVPVTDPEATRQVVAQLAQQLAPFTPDGAVESLASRGRDGLLLRFSGTRSSGAPGRMLMFFRSVGNRFITCNAICDAAVAASAEPIALDIFASAIPGAGADASTFGGRATPRLARSFTNPAGGYSIGIPDGWSAQPNGPNAALVPPLAPGQSSPALLCALAAMPWMPGMPIGSDMVAEQVASMFAQSMPGMQRAGAIERLGQDGESGVLVRFRPAPGAGLGVEARLFAQSAERSLVFLIATADPPTLAANEPLLKDVFASLVITGAPAPASPGGAPPAPNSGQPGWPGAPGSGFGFPGASPPPAGSLDPNLVGLWATESAMSSPAPWNNLSEGGTSFATRTVYAFYPDGTFTLGSQTAGGNMNVGADTGFSLSAMGRWSAARTPQGQFLLFQHHDGSRSQIRYQFHEGRLVIGDQGNRSFWVKTQ